MVIIGAGINGIFTSVKLQRLSINGTLIDRQSALGGGWLLNTYPEACLDVLRFCFSIHRNEVIVRKKRLLRQINWGGV